MTTSEQWYNDAQVEKGCGMKADIQSEYGSRGKFDSARQCYVTEVETSNRVVTSSSSSGNTSLVTGSSDPATTTSTNEEVCYCEGSRCNTAAATAGGGALLYLAAILCILGNIQRGARL